MDITKKTLVLATIEEIKKIQSPPLLALISLGNKQEWVHVIVSICDMLHKTSLSLMSEKDRLHSVGYVISKYDKNLIAQISSIDCTLRTYLELIQVANRAQQNSWHTFTGNLIFQVVSDEEEKKVTDFISTLYTLISRFV